MKYLERFSSLVPAIQSNKVIRRIEKMRKRGEIQTEAEYNAALQGILSNLSTTEFKSTFEYSPIQPGISSSEHFNEMMDMVRDDLEVLFIEINNIFASVKAHDMLFRDKLLDELRFTLTELENQVNTLSVIGDTGNSFDEIFLNSFNGENFTIDRSGEFGNEILFDNRKNERIKDEETVFIDPEEKVATLPLADQEDILFVESDVKTAETTTSEKDIQLVDSDINSIIDPDSSASWTYNILKEKTLKNGAKLSIELDLGDKREVNYLRIHPISDFPVLLEKIQYVNANNNIVDLPDDSFFGTTLENPVRITFPDIIAKKFILKLSQASSVLFDYDNNRPGITFDDLKRKTSLKRSVAMLTRNIKKTIQDPDILSIIPLSPDALESFTVYNLYIFAFKSISAGLSGYKGNGHFVSKAYRKKSIGIIALDTEEIMPEIFDEEAGVTADVASFEYYIIKKDYNNAGIVINSTEFPILPLNTTGVKNERLHFNGGKKIISLRFLGHKSDNTGANIIIKRNNTILTRGIDWRFADRLDSLDDADLDLKPSLEETRIEILHDSDLIIKGAYTAEYIPRYIHEPNTVVEKGEIIYLPDGTTEHPTKKDIERISGSDIFLKAAMRNNSRSNNRTPKLKSYKILASSVDKNKHVRIK